MTAPHQDKRVEDLIGTGAEKVVDAALDALKAWPFGHVIAEAARADAVKAGRSALLELLAAVGVDTSAHVHAPAVDVHVHRPRCGWCGGALVASPTNETYTCADCRAVTPKFALPSMKG